MEIRISDDSVEITGYVNAVGRDSLPLRDRDGFFTEQVEPGAFSRALVSNPSVPVLLNHDPACVLASGEERELQEDAVGLHVRFVSSDPQIVSKAADGRLRGWSFGFKPIRETVGERDGLRHRVLQEIELLEVSLIDDRKTPAYPATSVYARDGEGGSMEMRFMEDPGEVRELREQDPPSLKEWTDRIDGLGVVEE